MTRWRRFWRRGRSIAVTAFSLVCISLALAIGLASALLPFVERYPQHVAGWLEQRLAMRVEVAAVAGRWSARGPVLTLQGLSMGDEDDSELQLGEAELAVDIYAWLLPRRHPLELRLDGLSLDLQRDDGGRWRLLGMHGGSGTVSSGSGERRWLSRLGAVRLSNAQVVVVDAVSDTRQVFGPASLLLRSQGQQLTLEAELYHGGDESAGILSVKAELGVREAGRDLQILRLWARADQLDLAAWLAELRGGPVVRSGILDAQLWLTRDQDAQPLLQTQLAVSTLVLQRRQPLAISEELRIRPQVAFASAQASLEMQRDSHGEWQLLLADSRYQRLGRQVEGPVLQALWDSNGRSQLWLDTLDVNDASALAVLLLDTDALSGWLHESGPDARVESLQIAHLGGGDFLGRASLRELSVRAVGDSPGIDALDAELHFDGAGLHATVVGKDIAVDTVGLFVDPLRFAEFSTQLSLYRHAGVWALGIDELSVSGEGFAVLAEGQLLPPQDEPGVLLDLHAKVLQGDVQVAKQFWPVRVMPAKTLSWLNRGLEAGTLTSGRASFVGNVLAWPFADAGPGRFVAHAEAVDGRLFIHERWGTGEGIDAQLRFINSGMWVESQRGSLHGNDVDWAQAHIADFEEAVLELDVQTAAEAARVLDWLRTTPLQTRLGGFLFGLALQGPVQLKTRIDLVLKEELGEHRVHGEVDLLGLQVNDAKWGLQMSRTSGALRFSDQGLDTEDVRGFIDGEPVQVDLAFGDATSTPEQVAEVRLRGPLAAEDLLALRAELAVLQGRLPGVSHWDLQFSLDEGDAATATWQLRLDSDLLGVGIDLPAPLGKGPSQSRPLSLQLHQQLDGFALSADVYEVLSVSAHWPDQQAPEVVVELGAGRAEREGSAGLRVAGHSQVLELKDWVELLGNVLPETDQQSVPIDIDIQLDQLHWGDARLGALALRLEQLGQRRELHLNGERIAGVISQPLDGADSSQWRVILDRLHWPASESTVDDTSSVASAPTPADDLRPATWPPLLLRIDDLQWGDLALGRLDVETYPGQDGLQLERFDLRSELLNARMRGEWRQLAVGTHTRMNAYLTSSDAGGLMSGLGYASALDSGQAVIQIDAGWPGSPAHFALASVSGNIDLSVSGGRIRDVQPGAGRILGLFSLTEIPRRLTLDFGDFFQQGLAFNSIRGRFHLERGEAFTDSLLILSPAAEVQISGRTGLVAREYDQEMLVLPAVGGSLPLVGALAAGPAGAAAGLMMQGMFNDPLRRAAAARYRIRGSWESPDVELLERPRNNPRG